jgi:hypothetical protein
MRRLRSLVFVLVTACNQVIDIPEVHPGACDPGAVFARVVPVGGLGAVGEQSARLSRDELTIVFSRELPDAPDKRFGDLYIAHRDHRDDEFGKATALDELNSSFDEFSASLSDDMRTLYFDRQVEDRRYEILAATRSAPDKPFGVPTVVSLGADASSNSEPFITDTAIFFTSTRSGGLASLFSAMGGGTSFEVPEPLMTGALDTAYEHPAITFDGLTIYFSKPPENTKRDILSASRSGPDEWFGALRPVAALNTDSTEFPVWISEDNCRLYFMTDRTQSSVKPNFELWMASRRTP